jgi:hypothetical protein
MSYNTHGRDVDNGAILKTRLGLCSWKDGTEFSLGSEALFLNFFLLATEQRFVIMKEAKLCPKFMRKDLVLSCSSMSGGTSSSHHLCSLEDCPCTYCVLVSWMTHLRHCRMLKM